MQEWSEHQSVTREWILPFLPESVENKTMHSIDFQTKTSTKVLFWSDSRRNFENHLGHFGRQPFNYSLFTSEKTKVQTEVLVF